MTNFLIRFRDNWKQNYAAIVVYGYFYNILFWPMILWATTIGTLVTGHQWPAPPLVPVEFLYAATANLLVIGGVQLLKDKQKSTTDASQ